MATMAEADEYNGIVDDKFDCSVCNNLMRNLESTICCGQAFCNSCFQQWKSSSCPFCRKENYRIERAWKVDCLNRSEGCQWSTHSQTAQVSALTHHLKNNCQYVRVVCTLNCGETVYQSQLKQHMDKCPQRPFECIYCGKKDTYSKITGETKVTGQKTKVLTEKGHYAECPKCITECPNHCGKTIKREEIVEHRKQCQREPVHCSFKGLNFENTTTTCGEKMLRSELPNHQKVCTLRPFKCMFCSKESTFAAITGNKSNIKQPRIPPEQGHYAECPDYPLVCRNNCHSTIKRSQMEAHLTECPLERVPCPLEEFGCQDRVKRKNLNKHLKNYQERHLNLYGLAYEETKRELDTTKTQLAENNSTKAQLNVTRAELNREKLALQSTRTELNRTREELDRTKRELNRTKIELNSREVELGNTKQELKSTKSKLSSTTEELQRAKQGACRQM